MREWRGDDLAACAQMLTFSVGVVPDLGGNE